ncbi:MAG: UDP-N-acetylmuramoyl-L-alanyl-D-glutamate--2,6-diaminopimelate ligase, partial [Mogibacterium sp.]|nr:UDP-N-acetylmuramoyl-L-alanyl-D-glutamate--2,6-diaminopimelate ligase [Mogibacterium sp.]
MNICVDSRKVQPGDMFFCLVGHAQDGHRYAGQAAEKGAAVIVHSRDIPYTDKEGVIYIRVEDTLRALNEAASTLYGRPSEHMTMFGVTGTNGKSSIAYLICKIYSKYAGTCGYMGTIGGVMGDRSYKVNLTTPDIVPLHATLAQMRRDGAVAASLEASSHGLIQGRVDAIDFDYAIYTNLTREHLDYFHDMETYFLSKRLFFEHLKPTAVAMVNADDPYCDRIREVCTGRFLTYAIDADADYKAEDVVYSPEGMAFTIVYQGQRWPVRTNLQVTYNLYNLLAIAGTLHQAGLAMEDIAREFLEVEIPGRMTEIRRGQDFRVIVDYAHTDDSYNKLLHYVRCDLPGIRRIITVSGAPGQRDSGNRPIFGRILSKFCDFSILCEEDHRDEPPSKIAAEIASGMSEGYPHTYIENRGEAIQAAVDMAEPGDIVLILAKGAEKYLDKAEGKVYWEGDDVSADKAVRNRLEREA